MKAILKNKEINQKNCNYTDKIFIKTYFNLSVDKWFKGSRSRGIR